MFAQNTQILIDVPSDSTFFPSQYYFLVRNLPFVSHSLNDWIRLNPLLISHRTVKQVLKMTCYENDQGIEKMAVDFQPVPGFKFVASSEKAARKRKIGCKRKEKVQARTPTSLPGSFISPALWVGKMKDPGIEVVESRPENIRTSGTSPVPYTHVDRKSVV